MTQKQLLQSVLILMAVGFIGEFLAFEFLVGRIQADTERRVLAEVTDNAELRCRTNNAWLGFSAEDVQRVYRIAKDFHVSPQFLGAFWEKENGRIQHETGMFKVPGYIRVRYQDPRDWALASTADLCVKIGMRRLMGADQLNPFVHEIARVYNPENRTAWESDLTERTFAYFGYARLPITRPHRAAKPRRKK